MKTLLLLTALSISAPKEDEKSFMCNTPLAMTFIALGGMSTIIGLGLPKKPGSVVIGIALPTYVFGVLMGIRQTDDWRCR